MCSCNCNQKVLTTKVTANIPEQTVPFPLKPGRHSQLKFPIKLLHVDETSQLFCPFRHSSMSAKEVLEHTQLMEYNHKWKKQATHLCNCSYHFQQNHHHKNMKKNHKYWHKKLCSYCSHGCHPRTRPYLRKKNNWYWATMKLVAE